jgi:hypothetical protein
MRGTTAKRKEGESCSLGISFAIRPQTGNWPMNLSACTRCLWNWLSNNGDYIIYVRCTIYIPCDTSQVWHTNETAAYSLLNSDQTDDSIEMHCVRVKLLIFRDRIMAILFLGHQRMCYGKVSRLFMSLEALRGVIFQILPVGLGFPSPRQIEK